jgi:3-hydroxyisobutyrate dehydrogenase-like beta-hydroxyacid dehydrogenase
MLLLFIKISLDSTMKAKSIGIIGLGRVGMPVASAYLQAGYKVYGIDVDARRKSRFEAIGGELKLTPAAVADTVGTLLLMVLNDDQALEVVNGEYGVLSSHNSDLTLICMSTINRSSLEEIARKCRDQGIRFIDCPFTGGPARIPEGRLTLITAGNSEDIEAARPVLSCIGSINVVGDTPGLGQAVKHCNQLLVGATHAATMEVIALSRRLDLDAEQVCKVVGEGIAGSDYFRLLSEAVLKGTPSPGGLGQMCKDVAIVKNTTDAVALPALVISAAADYFRQAENSGMQLQEGAALIEVVNGD